MGTLDLTSDYTGKKVRIQKDLIIAIDSLESAAVLGGSKTRVYLRGGKFKDVLEGVDQIRLLIR